MSSPTPLPVVDELKNEYKYGFVTDIESETLPVGLNEDVIRRISSMKNEPEYMLQWRLKAYHAWTQMKEPKWAEVKFPPIDYQKVSYFSRPKKKIDSLEDADPKLLETFKKLGLPLSEQMHLAGVKGSEVNTRPGIPGSTLGSMVPEGQRPNVAMDVVFDSVSVVTTFQDQLAKHGIIFCSFSEATRKHPELIQKYLGSVVPVRDNFFAALNSAVFSDGTFVYIPPGVHCPMELSTYFRMNAENTGQFERTLIVADNDAYASYLEGCTAPQRDENQLHAAVVELIAHDRAHIKYSTVQNWYPGDENGNGGVYNFVTKRGLCKGNASRISWTQVETGSAITWKYPSCVLKGDYSVGEFYSVAFTCNYQQADTGTKMLHLGKGTKSTIISKGISAGHSVNTYRGLVRVGASAENARNYTRCDSLIMGKTAAAHTYPYNEVKNKNAQVEHEATTSKVSDAQLYFLRQRGLSEEDAVHTVVNGFCKEVFRELPMEFAVEAQKLLEISLEEANG
ncbi:MAG: FeS cluster assembly protein SufB [Turneriella sp.]|nr:FeS cluster assembly protein SufB [Turneriella sp.]